jgi:hypothetical protein
MILPAHTTLCWAASATGKTLDSAADWRFWNGCGARGTRPREDLVGRTPEQADEDAMEVRTFSSGEAISAQLAGRNPREGQPGRMMRAKMPSIRSMLLFLAGCRPGPGHREVGRADCAPYLAAAAYMIPSIMRSRAGPAKRKIALSDV